MIPLRTLILGGTSEASALARSLAGDRRFDATLSLAGVTEAPVRPPIRLRIGGFGGPAGLLAHLLAEAIDVLVDATHPFAARISANAHEAADAARIRRIVVGRPAWQPRAGDLWTPVADMETAAAALGRSRCRVLLTVGRQELAAFAARPWHKYVIRSIDPPGEAAPPGAEIITARGPFELEDELRLLKTRRIEVIVTKNSGGSATYAKLAAANQLRVPVVMVERPPSPAGEVVTNAGAVMAILERLHQAALVPRTV